MSKKKELKIIGNAIGIGIVLAIFGILAMTSMTTAIPNNGNVWTWGSNIVGQLGDGTTINRLTPVQVSGLTNVINIAGGESYTIALKSDGTVWSWGWNEYGELGDGTATQRLTPVQVSRLTDVVDIAGGSYHAIALKSDGTVWAWGSNRYGQLGYGTTTTRRIPVQVSGLTNVVKIASKYEHTIALKSDGTVWAWGFNAIGQLGDGTKTNRLTPVQVSMLTDVIDIASGNYHTIALKSDGTVWGWGSGLFGQLGDDIYVNSSIPVQVNGLIDVIDIAAGVSYTIALKSDGTVWTLGGNANGLGDGTSTGSSIPVKASGLTDIIEIAGGYQHTIALKSDGTVWTWGDNEYGQLGDGTTTDRLTPVQVSGLTNVIEIAGGSEHTIVLVSRSQMQTNITTPTNNSYSEESVNFSGTANGGTPPYTYTWKSDIDGTLNITTTASTSNEFNKILTMGTRNISLTVQDSIGNTQTKTVILNVVKQKIKILVVPATPTGRITDEEQKRIDKTIKDVREFYLKSSYGSIYLDFSKYKSIIQLNANLDNSETILLDVMDKLSIDSIYSTIVIVAPITGKSLTYIPNRVTTIGGPTMVAEVPIQSQIQFGIWTHEIGHSLGYTVSTSETYNNPETMLWGGTGSPACADLYNCGNVYAWDVMATGDRVFNIDSRNNQPTDMSVLSKTKLGWLDNKKNFHEEISGEYSVKSTENMRYDESALIYKTSNNVEYYIEARELIQPSYYRDSEVDLGPLYGLYTLNNGILIYKINHNSNGKDSINILRQVPSLDKIGCCLPTFLASDGTSVGYTDYSGFVKFKVSDSDTNHPYNVKIRIDPCNDICKLINGVILVTTPILWNHVPFLYSTDINSTSPDLDLHAYTQDGKHVGMNYISGEYDMKIPGTVASGDLIGGEEWIFVPIGTQVRYFVDSHDVKKFLEENPDVNIEDAKIEYSTSSMEYGKNPQLQQLPDGSYTVVDRVVFGLNSETIEPGVSKEIYGYDITFLPPTENKEINISKDSILPIKFSVSNSATDEFIYDETVKVSIKDSIGSEIIYGTDEKSVKIDKEKEQYFVDFNAKDYPLKVGEIYTIEVTFGESDSLKGYGTTHFKVVDRQGGSSISIIPRSSNVINGNKIQLNIKAKNTQNVFDTFRIHINTTDLPATYRANIGWFEWTEKIVDLKSGEEISIPINVTIPNGITGNKMFRARINSTTSSKVYAFDTGTLKIT